MRLARIVILALLIAWGLLAPPFSFTRGHLVGYSKGVHDVLKVWDAVRDRPVARSSPSPKSVWR